jgi:predicted DsbA family dithiol-disulfide isomerase
VGPGQGRFPIERLDPPAHADLEVVVDYVDPGSWLTFLHLEALASSSPGLRERIRWRPLELSPPGAPPVDTDTPEWRAMAEALAREARALGASPSPATLHGPAPLPRSRKAHELAFHARAAGSFDAVHRALFEARFVGGEDLGRVDVLVEIAGRAGLDTAEARTVLGVDRFADAVEEARRELLAGGVRGVPTLRIPERPDAAPLEGFGGNDAFVLSLRQLLNPASSATIP